MEIAGWLVLLMNWVSVCGTPLSGMESSLRLLCLAAPHDGIKLAVVSPREAQVADLSVVPKSAL